MQHKEICVSQETYTTNIYSGDWVLLGDNIFQQFSLLD